MRKQVVVIGGGIAGLATAALVATDGHEVTLLEQRPALGGRVGCYERDGFRFDTGPTVLTMPDLIADALDCVGEKLDWQASTFPATSGSRSHSLTSTAWAARGR